jgi:hypothetical protein
MGGNVSSTKGMPSKSGPSVKSIDEIIAFVMPIYYMPDAGSLLSS